MKCLNCGKELPNDAKFCSECGYQFFQQTNENDQQYGGYQNPQSNAQGGYWQNGQYVKGPNPNAGNANQPKKKNGCLVAVIVCVIIFVLLCILFKGCMTFLSGLDGDSSEKTSTSTSATKTEEATETASEKKIEDKSEEVTETTTEKTKDESKKEKDEFDASEYRTDIGYDSLSRKPDDYVGKKISMKGRVNSHLEYDNETMLQVDVSGNG
ncbi:MAG: zinc ribbon domain-containing protein, partial [Eubacterium sp.]|nr:zinc ribbon domain-containing protein [Eubacterium sp.]